MRVSAKGRRENAKGLRLLHAGRYTRAISAFTLAIAACPEWADAFRNRAEAHRRWARDPSAPAIARDARESVATSDIDAASYIEQGARDAQHKWQWEYLVKQAVAESERATFWQSLRGYLVAFAVFAACISGLLLACDLILEDSDETGPACGDPVLDMECWDAIEGSQYREW